LAAVFRDRRLASVLAPVALLEISVSWIQSITPLYAEAGGTLTASGIGLLFTYAGALGVILQMPITTATERMSGFSIVSLSGAMLAVAFACLFVSPSLPSLIAAITLLALSEMLSGPLAQAIITELAPRSAKATYQAAFSGLRSQGCGGTCHRYLALCAFGRVALGERYRCVARRGVRPRRCGATAREW
jgi:MFS transporter, DHA1 family, tetracycline resistance protein